MTVDDDGYYSSGIHPPDVVLVSSSNATSPTLEVLAGDLTTSASLDRHNNDDTICSPLSTAPNSPHRRVSYDEEDDDDDADDEDEEVVIRPEEIQEVLNTPVSGKYSTNYNKLKYSNRVPHEVPFDESHHTNPPPLPKTTTTTTASETTDPLLGNPRLYQQQASHSKSASPAAAAVVTPSSGAGGGIVLESPIVVNVDEDIDAYVEEDDDGIIHHINNNSFSLPPTNNSLDDRDEKKVDTTPQRSRSPPHYAGFLTSYNNGSAHKILSEQLNLFSSLQPEDRLVHPRVVPLTMSEEDMPHDERLDSSGEMEEFMETGDFIESTRSGGPGETDSLQENNDDDDDDDGSNTPIKKALATAEREVQEMERRVQLMIQQRRQSSSRSQQRFSDEHDSTTQSKLQGDPSDCYVMEEPPSLSPQTGAAAAAARNKDVHSSVDSGCSSFYYDGSVMGSTASNNSSREAEDAMNMTLNSNTSSLALAAATTTTSNSLSTSTQQREFYSRLESSGSPIDSSREERSSKTALSSSGSGFVTSTTFEEFTSRFDHEATNGTFARAIDETSRAFNQVTEDVANFLNGPSFTRETKQQQQAFHQRLLPLISPSHDSDRTPQFGNLSPRPTMNGSRPFNATAGAATFQRGAQSTNADADLLCSQRPSAKLAKARSLVSGRQSRLSPTTAGYEDVDTKDRARQVMNKREQQQSNRDGASQRSSGNNAAVPSISSSKSDVSTSIGLPVPPTLTRIAAIMESLGGGSSAYGVGNQNETVKNDYTEDTTDWQSSVSQLMEEYQTAITESLRNLSMEEVAGLARQHENTGHLKDSGKETMISPEIPLSSGPQFLAFDDQRNGATRNSDNPKKVYSDSHDEYDDIVAEITFGACLQMPELDHPPLMTTRNSGTAQQGNKDYKRGVAGVLQYDHCSVTELLYHDEQDDHFRHFGGGDPEHQERAVFAKQLSERLLSLGATSSADTTASVECRDSPEKLRSMRDDNDLSFESKESSMAMSPPKRSKDASGETLDGAGGGTGLFVCSLPQAKCIPSSEQPSVCSDGFSLEHSNANSRLVSPNRDTGATKSGSNAGSSVIKPTMVESIDNETGIAKGDVMLSLLCDNSFQASKEKPDSWAWRVREAIWRCRDMRSDFCGPMGSKNGLNDDGDMREIRRTPSLPVDVDDVRVVGGIHNVASIQEKALAHLRQNEFEQALELYEDIIFNYYSFFEQVLARREEFSSEDVTMELSNFKPYIGASLHNLGVIRLLKGDYDDAFSFFKRAVDNRRACLGETHSDCITSLVRLATCRFAMDNFADAHTNLELALALAGSKARTTNDYCQLGEILNNLGCLSYMCGQPTKAMKLFRESLDVQLAVLNSTLYGGSKYSAHSATLSISVTRGNIGFLALVLKDVSSGILALESALREQRLLLNGAHVTLVSTMDHLAVANLLQGRTQKAVKMLRRIYDLQKAAHGPNDPRCFATRQKIMTIRGQQVRASNTDHVDHTTSGPTQKQEQPSAVRPRPERQQSAHSQQQQQQQQVGGRPRHAGKQTSDGESSSRCTPGVGGGSSSNNSHSHNNGNGGNKVGLFKAIRSLGRKKTT